MTIKLLQGDCLEMMKDIPDGSVDMILTDPPYGTYPFSNERKVNMILTDPPYGTIEGDVSHGMKGRAEWDKVIDHVAMLEQCNRILRTNGALALFAQDPYTGKITTETHGNLPFSYRMTWLKDNFANSLIAKKAPVNYTEDVCLFFKKYDTLAQHPLRDYAEEILFFLGMTLKEINADLGHRRAEHFFYINSTQFGLCTEEVYNELIAKYNIDRLKDFKTYTEMKEINRRFSRRFNLPEGEKYKSNVLEYKKDYTGLHPTQKPLSLMEDLIRTYTNEGETVLDFTMGSGTTMVAAKNLNRHGIGIELDPSYYAIAVKRVNSTT